MKILLFMPNFFDYPEIICDGIRKAGHEVDFFDDRPSTNSFVKAAVRLNRNMVHLLIKSYFDRIMKTIEGRKYDRVLLISGQSLSFSEDMIARLKAAQPQAEFVLYQWDSLENFSYIKAMHRFFDRRYSFDRGDVESEKGLSFLPLFYCEKYEKIGEDAAAGFKYDLLFAGTAHPKKYKYIREMAEKLRPVWSRQFIYFFLPSRLVYIYRKTKNPEFKGSRYGEFHFTPISGEEMIKLFKESKCILDSPQDGQAGLTMRVFEALGAKRKLITTNSDIKNYDFYREENIYVYDGSIDSDSVFFKEPYADIEPLVYEKYSLRSWLNELLYGGEG